MERISVEQMPEVENEEQMRHLVRYVNFINSRPERDLHQKSFHTHHVYPRSMAIEINLTNEQMIDKIKKTLQSFHPEIDMKIKEQALAFLKEWAPGVKAIDYRELEKVCIAIEIQGNDWKNFAILMLSSQ